MFTVDSNISGNEKKECFTIGGSRDQGLILNSDSGTEVN